MSKDFFCAFISVILFFSQNSLAEEESPSTPSLTQYWSGEIFGIASYANPVSSVFNPGNHVLQNPSSEQIVDLRLQYKYEIENFKVVARPRLYFDAQQIQFTDNQSWAYPNIGQSDLTVGYAEWAPHPSTTITAGLIVDGWGPAEFINPSNPFIHMDFQNKDFNFLEKGKVLAKVLYNPSASDTLSAEIEPISNNQSPYQQGVNFFPSWALRAERQTKDNTWILGATAGQDFAGDDFLGQYATVSSPDTGWSTYAELRETYQPQRFEPVAMGPYLDMVLKATPYWNTFSVVGLRYESRVDTRLEWIYYETGYSQNDWKSITTALTQLSPYIVSNGVAFQNSGLEFPTKNWLSLSVRTPDLGPRNLWQWINRVLISTGDSALNSLRSGFFQSDLEAPVFDSWTLYGEGRWSFGNTNTELLLTNTVLLTLGVRCAW
jgi:hypothetical protein